MIESTGSTKIIIRTSNAAIAFEVFGTNDLLLFSVLDGGKIGIERLPSTNALEVNGDASKTAAGFWLANSDRRIKTDVRTIDQALEMLNRVRLVSFAYTEEYRADHEGIGEGRYLNVIAQEFAEVFPDHVKGSGEYLPDGSEILQVDTYPLTIYSAAAIQEQQLLIEAQQEEIEQLKSQLADQKNFMGKRLEKLEALVLDKKEYSNQ